MSGADGRLVADLLSGVIVHEGAAGTSRVLHTSEPGERDRAEQRLVADLIGGRSPGVGIGSDPVETHAAPRCTLADGTAAVALVHAAHESAAAGRRATVPPP